MSQGLDDHVTRPTPSVWLSADDASVDAFRRLVDRAPTRPTGLVAARIERNVLIYDGPAVARAAADPARPGARRRMAAAFATGPGVLVIAGAYPDPAPIDRATDLFARSSRTAPHRTGGGDHSPSPAPTTASGTR